MDNSHIAHLFAEMADLMEIFGENAFKIRAYQRAAREIENLTVPVAQLREEGTLGKVEGIGKAIEEKIGEALDTGKIRVHEELKANFPEGILTLLSVPGMGPKKVKLVYDQLGISNVPALKQAAEAGQLRGLPGMGQKTEEKILKGISNIEQSMGRHHLGVAYPIAQEILGRIREVSGVKEAEFAGSLRRGKETVGDLDLLVTASDSEVVMLEFLRTRGIVDTVARGSTKTSVLLDNGLQVDLRVVPQESYGAALQYFTGSKEHNVKLRELAVKKGLKINEYGVFEIKTDKRIASKTEVEVYKSMGLKWIPPELREGFDEIDLAHKELPKLIELGDVRGTLHNHTTASDGRMSLAQLVEEAEKRGFEFLAVTDHSVALGVANGLSPDRLRRQIEEIHEWNEKQKGIRLLAGNEVDVLSDGSLAYDDRLLAELDIVIASVHVAQEQPRAKLMDRIIRTLENPYVDIMAHPSGRLIGRRPPMDLDMEALFAKAAETGTALEINSHYQRLDLNDKHIREAKKHGVMFTLDTDTHAVADFANIEYGLKTARRGRLMAEDVLNTLPLKKFLKTIKHGKVK